MTFILKETEVDAIIRHLKYSQIYANMKRVEDDLKCKIDAPVGATSVRWSVCAEEAQSLRNLLFNQKERN